MMVKAEIEDVTSNGLVLRVGNRIVEIEFHMLATTYRYYVGINNLFGLFFTDSNVILKVLEKVADNDELTLTMLSLADVYSSSYRSTKVAEKIVKGEIKPDTLVKGVYRSLTHRKRPSKYLVEIAKEKVERLYGLTRNPEIKKYLWKLERLYRDFELIMLAREM